MRVRLLLLVGVACCALVQGSVLAEEGTVDGTVELKASSVNIGVGFRWGEGVLKYQGKDYPFSLDGLTVGAIGASTAQVSGDVVNLKKLEDFNGVYKGLAVNALIGAGGGGNELKNEKGVTLRLSRTSVGLKLQVGGDGVKITLKNAK